MMMEICHVHAYLDILTEDLILAYFAIIPAKLAKEEKIVIIV